MKRATILVILAAPFLSGCVAAAGVGLIAAGTAGISATRQERTVGDAIDDVRITSNIQSALGRQQASNFFNVSTTVHEGRVLLTGRVANPQTRLDATRIAWSVEGVRKVDNEIEVTDETGWIDRPRDIFIRTEIAADLLTDRSIRDVNYTIDVVNGVVYLSGVAQNQAELDRVIARASRFRGVKRVESYVVLKDDPGRYYGGIQAGL
jgi:osmotically-inducible protein OsmY